MRQEVREGDHITVASGLWTDPDVWLDGKVPPTDGDVPLTIWIEKGHRVLFGITTHKKTYKAESLAILGKLVFGEGAGKILTSDGYHTYH